MYGQIPKRITKRIETVIIFICFFKNFFVYICLDVNETIKGPATNKRLTQRVRSASPNVTPKRIVGFFSEKFLDFKR
jgi:hypothetical protein